MGPNLFQHGWFFQHPAIDSADLGVFCSKLRLFEASWLIYSKYSFEDLLKMHGENIGITARLLRVVEWLSLGSFFYTSYCEKCIEQKLQRQIWVM